ncbi:MAG: diguanylate cyclase [Dokdonella sp.]
MWIIAAWVVALALAVPMAAVAQQVQLNAHGIAGVEPSANTTALPSVVTLPDPTEPLGRYAVLLDEVPGQPLTLEDARSRLAAGDFTRSTLAVPNLGNHAPPRWLHLELENTESISHDYRIYVAEGWTDRIDGWLTTPDGATRHWQAGDQRSPSKDLHIGLGFGFDARLPPGRSKLFVRADSVDSVALALRVVPLADTGPLEGAAQHWLGLVHGFLLALVITYGLLWLALRETSLLRYVAYVGSYLYMHLAYSGLAAHLVWPHSPAISRFAILIGMCLFSSAGISFARDFLGVASWAPLLDRVLAWMVRLALGLMTAFVLFDAQGPAVTLAFTYITSFTLLMVALGVLGLRHNRGQAGIFLVAAVISMAGALITTLAVMGKIPFSDMIFRLIEVGIMLEATIWALALGLRLRRDREDRVYAMQLAQQDPLTGLFNRRGFLDRALPAYDAAVSDATALAVIMIDIDHFKTINDQHGHDAGDRTLVAVAERLRELARADDLIARWGGEEFVILLPKTTHQEAINFAERQCLELDQIAVALADGGTVRLTASLGVASSTASDSLEHLLRQADDALYNAKQAGRNRVESAAA